MPIPTQRAVSPKREPGRSRIALENPADFVLTRRRKACPLAPPQHGGARYRRLRPEVELR